MTVPDGRQLESSRRILGFDFGAQRIGVAFGQEASGTARPLRSLRADSPSSWDHIRALMDEWAPDLFVVGVPLHADGSPTDTTRAVERFIRRLDGRFGLPVETVDERLSSHEAGARLRAGARQESLDAMAACVIVEDWLRRNEQQP